MGSQTTMPSVSDALFSGDTSDTEAREGPCIIVRTGKFEQLQHKIDRAMLKRLTSSNEKRLSETASCVCCGSNFARAFELQASFVKLFARRDNCSDEERNFLTKGDLIAWCTASVSCDSAAALEKLEDIRQTYRRLHLTCNQRCSVCLHRPGFHSIKMVGVDLQARPVIFSAFDAAASLGLNRAGLPSYLAHLFNMINDSLCYLSETQHGVCLVFDCTAISPDLYTVENMSSVAEMLKLLPSRIAYVILCRLKYLHRRLLTPLLYLTGLEDRVIYLSNCRTRDLMEPKLAQLFPKSLAAWIAKKCIENS